MPIDAPTTARRAGRPLDPAKREAILAAAECVFVEDGYGVSMDRIAEMAGVSKQTVYKHFDSKDQLFDAVIRQRVETITQPIMTGDPTAAPAQVLLAQGIRFLELLGLRGYSCLVRTILAAGTQGPDIGPHFYANGPGTSLRRLADYLRRQDVAGTLRVPDPLLAAEHFYGLVTGHLQLRALLGEDAPLDEAQRRQRAEAAVSVFMAAYGPNH